MQFIQGLPIQQEMIQIIEDLQAEVSGTGLLETINQTGNNIMINCPIHKDGLESSPSCGVTINEVTTWEGKKLEAGTVNCFTCGYTASLPEMISNVLGYNDRGRFGFKWLSRKYQFVDVNERKPIQIVKKKEEVKESINYVSEEELASYRYTHPYMYQRGLTDYYIELFDIGYCKDTQSITFPVKDEKGRCMFIQKRSVEGKRFDNDSNASKATLYGIDILQRVLGQISEVVIVESPIDTITLWQWGIPALGTMQAIPTAQQISIINKLPVRSLISAQDNDNAGLVGATRLREKSSKLVKRLKFPNGIKDVNEMSYNQYATCKADIAFKGKTSIN